LLPRTPSAKEPCSSALQPGRGLRCPRQTTPRMARPEDGTARALPPRGNRAIASPALVSPLKIPLPRRPPPHPNPFKGETHRSPFSRSDFRTGEVHGRGPSGLGSPMGARPNTGYPGCRRVGAQGRLTPDPLPAPRGRVNAPIVGAAGPERSAGVEEWGPPPHSYPPNAQPGEGLPGAGGRPRSPAS
jgi:hypothetical protein